MTGLALPALMAMVLSAGLISTAAASGTPTASTTAAADYLPAKEGNENANARPHRDPTIVRHIASAICRVNLEGVPALGVLCSAFENAGLIDEAKHAVAVAIVKQARASNPEGLRALIQELDIDWPNRPNRAERPERPERNGESDFGLRQGRPFGNDGQFAPDDGQS
jgi:hypothetical protein